MMIIFYLAFIYSILGIYNSSSSVVIERVDQIILDYDWAEGVNRMAIVNRQAYLLRQHSYDIYVVDLSNKTITSRLGGQGKGPGEFENFISGIYTLKDGLAITSVNWVHFFDRSGKFQNRLFLKNSSIVSISNLLGEQLIVGTKSYLGGNELNTISNVGILKSRNSNTFDYEKFGNRNQIENMTLNSYVIDSDNKNVVIGQFGSNELRYLNHSGALVRKIALAGNPGEITFRDVPEMASETYLRISEQLGIKLDQRLPSHGIVMDIFLTPKSTIVQGLFDHNGNNKRFAVVNHSTWSVDYLNLGAPCRSMTVENDMMYCLNAPPNKTPQIDIYRIKVN